MSLPILDFLVERMTEYDESFEHRIGTAFSDLFMQPLSLIIQPLRDEANEIQTNQSLKRILELDEPDLYPEDAVDELIANVYVTRRPGSRSSGIIRVLYNKPKDLNVLSETLIATNSVGLRYFNVNSIAITANEMANNTEQELYYVDIVIDAEEEGDEFNAAANGIVGINDSDVVRVSNTFPIDGGAPRETNIEVINRTRESIGVRDLNTGKGFNAIMFENFQQKLLTLQAVGFGDPEMMRDIVFNYHIGGRVDGFTKTPTIKSGIFDVFGLTIDVTRRETSAVNLIMAGVEELSFGVQSLDTTEQLVRGFNVEEVDRPAIFFSYINLENGIDLSARQFIGLSINDGEFFNIKISGSSPSTTQAGEIINRINVALQETIASVTVNPIVVSRRRTGYVQANGTQKFIDPTPRVFANISPGDRVAVLVGSNAGTYVIQSIVNDNELSLEQALPFEQTDVNYRVVRSGMFIKLQTQTRGADSKITIGSPLVGTDALPVAIGLVSNPTPYEFSGRGKVEFVEAVDFAVDLTLGLVSRIIGTTILTPTTTGEFNKDIYFEDSSSDKFLNVDVGDVLTISNSANNIFKRDYRILDKISNNRLRIDAVFFESDTDVEYRINRTGIKNNDLVYYTFEYNPMTVDIGDQIQLDKFGRVLGIREGREDRTITDLALLYITKVELIDPVSGEPLGVELEGRGGFGLGAFGRGGYGRGSRSEWRIVVNKPELRFSALEDAYLNIATAYLGQSFRIHYRYVPEIVEFQTFVKSEDERILDADTLMRHFLPAVVDMEINYTTDPNNPDTPSKGDISEAIKVFIETRRGTKSIDASDIVDVIYEQIDPSRNRDAKVGVPITMVATIHNTDGSKTIVANSDELSIPETEIAPFTTRPLSPRIAHWVAGTITLNETRVKEGGVIS